MTFTGKWRVRNGEMVDVDGMSGVTHHLTDNGGTMTVQYNDKGNCIYYTNHPQSNPSPLSDWDLIERVREGKYPGGFIA